MHNPTFKAGLAAAGLLLFLSTSVTAQEPAPRAQADRSAEAAGRSLGRICLPSPCDSRLGANGRSLDGIAADVLLAHRGSHVRTKHAGPAAH
jgi:hypothetical protein